MPTSGRSLRTKSKEKANSQRPPARVSHRVFFGHFPSRLVDRSWPLCVRVTPSDVIDPITPSMLLCARVRLPSDWWIQWRRRRRCHSAALPSSVRPSVRFITQRRAVWMRCATPIRTRQRADDHRPPAVSSISAPWRASTRRREIDSPPLLALRLTAPRSDRRPITQPTPACALAATRCHNGRAERRQQPLATQFDAAVPMGDRNCLTSNRSVAGAAERIGSGSGVKPSLRLSQLSRPPSCRSSQTDGRRPCKHSAATVGVAVTLRRLDEFSHPSRPSDRRLAPASQCCRGRWVRAETPFAPIGTG